MLSPLDMTLPGPVRHDSRGLNLCVISCHVLWREICYYASVSPNTFDFRFLEQGLHNTPELLRETLQKAVDEAGDGFDALLIGYGLCSNGLAGITARSTKLVAMRAHDCITFLLGSRERYQEYFDAHPGTYWYSPGWIDDSTMPGKTRYEETLKEYTAKYGDDNAAYLMEIEQGWVKQYSNAAYVDLGFYDTAAYKDYTKECAAYLGWQTDFLKGDPQLMRDFLDGRWDSDAFVIAEPGETIVATHDEKVLGARKVQS